MAEKKTENAVMPEEMVEIELFYDGDKYRDDVFVQVNGKSLLIKRGEKVKVPARYAEAIQNSLHQKAQTAEMMNRYQREFEAATKNI